MTMTTPFRWAFWMALSYLLSPISLLAQGTPIATTAFTRTMLRGADSAAVRTSLGFLTTNNTVITNYTGDGAAITNLNATELRSGTVPLARLSGITASQIAATTITTNNVDSTFYNLVTNRSSSGDVTQSGLAAGSYAIAGNGLGLTNIFNNLTVNGVQIVGNNYIFKTTNADPGTLAFNTTAHGASHGIVLLGANQGDVVLNPTLSDGVIQIGVTGDSGNRIHIQYAADPAALGTNSTLITGFSHPLRFVSVNKTNRQFHYPGIVGTSELDTAGVTENGTLRFYADTPHWAQNNRDVDNPTELGFETFRASTNAIQAAIGIPFAVGANVGQTISVSYLDGNTNVTFANFTGGLLTSVGIDSDAQSYIAAAGITSISQKQAINTFVISTKADGDWTNIVYLAPFIGGSSNAHRVYLKGSGNLTFLGSSGGYPSHSANGVTFDGVDDYSGTGFTPSTDGGGIYLQNSAHILIASPTASAFPIADFTTLVGVTKSDGTSRAHLSRSSTIITGGLHNGEGNAGSVGTTDHRGVLLTSRTSSTNQAIYLNNLAVGLSATATTSLPNAEMVIGAHNYAGNFQFSAYTCAGFEVGGGLNASAAARRISRWQILNTALGR